MTNSQKIHDTQAEVFHANLVADAAMEEASRLRAAQSLRVEFLRQVVALCEYRGSCPEAIEGFDPEEKWIADLWREAERLIASNTMGADVTVSTYEVGSLTVKRASRPV